MKTFFKFKREKAPRSKDQILYDKPGEPDCNKCGLNKNVKSPKIPVGGKGYRDILIIAESPGATEDSLNDELVGDVGQFFERLLEERGINLHEDCNKINAINCRPPKNRTPLEREIKFCRPWVLKAIEDTKPKYIWLMGSAATKSFFMYRFKKRNITRWRGYNIPDQKFKSYIIPLYHPSAPYRDSKNDNLWTTYLRDLDNAVEWSKIDKFPDYENMEKKVRVLTNLNEVEESLRNVLIHKPSIAIDYETTGKKPFKPDHKIYYASISTNTDTFSFPFQKPGYWKNEELNIITKMLIEIWEEDRIKKSAHNMAFEMLWSKVILGCDPKGVDWCSMIASHIIDSRQETKGLKFQTYINFGIEGYEDEVEPFLKTENEEYNKIQDAPSHETMLYCGLDSKFCKSLTLRQKATIQKDPHLLEAYELFHDAIHTFNHMQLRGFNVDTNYLNDIKEGITKRMDLIDGLISKSNEADKFRTSTGKPINHNSSKDLQYLLYDLLKYKPTRETKKGYSTDEESLSAINSNFTNLILKWRKLKKIRDTYLHQFFQEEFEGKINPFYNLTTARTFRSSSSDPNIHNIPVRDEEAKEYCRSGIKPSEDFRFIESDYSSMEVRIAGCYTEDPEWIKYLYQKGTDMHRDVCCELFLLLPKLVDSKVRFYGKNNWTFPQLYGSWYKACAENLWRNVVEGGLTTTEGQPMLDHLMSKNIGTYPRFEDHCKEVEKAYWDKYKYTKRWQEKVIKEYLQTGYVETFFGHRRSGYLTRNIIINTPIQGTAFHCLLWSCNKIDQISIEEGWESGQPGQIHDSMITDTYPPEQDMVCETIEQVATKDIRDKYKWIIVPLEMEFEFTPINGNWYLKEEVIRKEEEWVGKKSNKIYDLNY